MLRTELVMGGVVLSIQCAVLGPMRAPQLTMEPAVLPRCHRIAMGLAVDCLQVLMRSTMLRIEFVMGEGVLMVQLLVKRPVFVVGKGQGTARQHTNQRKHDKKSWGPIRFHTNLLSMKTLPFGKSRGQSSPLFP